MAANKLPSSKCTFHGVEATRRTPSNGKFMVNLLPIISSSRMGASRWFRTEGIDVAPQLATLSEGPLEDSPHKHPWLPGPNLNRLTTFGPSPGDFSRLA